MRIAIEAKALMVASGAVGFVTALTLSMPSALADPMQAEPVLPVAPGPVPAAAPAVAAPVVAPGPEPEAAPVVAAAVGAPAPTPAVLPLIPAPAAVPAAGPAVAPADPAISTPATTRGPAPGPVAEGTVQPATGALPTPPDGVPHLSSPQNLPPDTTDVPTDAGQPRGLGYLRDIWHAYQTQEVNGKGALLLLTQRPLDPNAAPPPGMSSNPTPPLVPGAALPDPGPPPPEPAPTP